MRKSLRDPNRPPTHPGAIIREVSLPALNMTKSAFANALGISRQMLHGILSEKHPITVETAIRIGHVLGNGPNIWIRLQQTYDLWHAQRNIDLSILPVLHPSQDIAA